MSGSEIMEEIEEHTGGRWKPSPGSVYPLLAWFKENGYIREIATEEAGIKRYMLTKKGGKIFEEQTKLKERLQKKLEFLVPLTFGELWSEKLREIREPVRRFLGALFNLRIALAENLTDHALKEATEFLNATTERIEEITERLASEKSSS